MSQLRTVRGEYSPRTSMNGTRGEAIVQMIVSELEYWIATSNPARDEPCAASGSAPDRR